MMELPWLLLPTAAILLPLVFILLPFARNRRRLPPGPGGLPWLGNLLYLQHFEDSMHILHAERRLHKRYGPVVGLRVSHRLEVSVADRHLAHTALVFRGAALADRTDASRSLGFVLGGATIASSNYGPLWRLLRRNLVAAIARPARLQQFAPLRASVVADLMGELRRRAQAQQQEGVAVRDAFRLAMFHLLLTICFGGERMDDGAVLDIAATLRELVIYGVTKIRVLEFLPALTTRLFRGRLDAMHAMRGKLKALYQPLVEGRRGEGYVDSLLDLRLDFDGGRSLTDDEVLALCSELVNEGTDTTATTLEWIMAELVKNQHVQERLYEEIKGISSSIREEELQQMQYLRAVVLEGLRRHPPAQQVVPHAAAEDVELGGCVIPKGTAVNFMVADMSMDEKTWERAAEFVPERFLPGGDGEGVDITGTKEIKMMPFGAGRRVCPGLGVATLHLEYFVASLVRAFEWRETEGEEVDVVSEAAEFTVVMKKPLRVHLLRRAA